MAGTTRLSGEQLFRNDRYAATALGTRQRADAPVGSRRGRCGAIRCSALVGMAECVGRAAPGRRRSGHPSRDCRRRSRRRLHLSRCHPGRVGARLRRRTRREPHDLGHRRGPHRFRERGDGGGRLDGNPHRHPDAPGPRCRQWVGPRTRTPPAPSAESAVATPSHRDRSHRRRSGGLPGWVLPRVAGRVHHRCHAGARQAEPSDDDMQEPGRCHVVGDRSPISRASFRLWPPVFSLLSPQAGLARLSCASAADKRSTSKSPCSAPDALRGADLELSRGGDALGIAHADLSQNPTARRTKHLAQYAGSANTSTASFCSNVVVCSIASWPIRVADSGPHR